MKRSALLLFVLMPVMLFAQNGSVLGQRKISDTTANFTGVLSNGVNFGSGVAAIGDLNNDGVTELVVGAFDAYGTGAVYTLFMNTDGSIDSFKVITEGQGGFTGDLNTDDRFGYKVAALGDLDLDNVPDVLVSSELDDEGGNYRGAVWILYLNANGTVKSHAKISSTTQGSLLAQPSYGIGDNDRFGSEVANIGDLDGDGIQDIAVTAVFDDDGGNNRGAVWIIFLHRNGSIKGYQKISDTQGGFTGTLADFSFFGSGIASLGDLDGDTIQDLIVGQELENAGGTYKGAAWVLFMNRNGTVKGHRELKSGLAGSGAPSMADNGMFGSSCAGLGDIDGDGVPDAAVGALGTDGSRGAVWILMLNTNGTIKAYQKISYNSGNLPGPLDFNDAFGECIANLGDLNGDNKTDIAVGAAFDDDGGSDKGALYILNLQGVPTNCVNAAFTGAQSPVCLGDTLTFTNTSTGPGTQTYTWKIDGVTYSTGANLTYPFNAPGSHTVRLVVSNASPVCVDSMTVTITVAQAVSGSRNVSICPGDSYFAGGASQTTAGTYYDTLQSSSGCDSVLTTVLTIRSIATNTVSQTICYGSSYMGHNATGVYVDTFTAFNGCDSIRTLNLTVRPQNTSTITQSICQGQTYAGYGSTGTYTDHFTDVNGCDSTRTLNLTVTSVIQVTLDTTVCYGDMVMGYDESMTYSDTNTSAAGCDSIFTLNLTVLPWDTTSIYMYLCAGDTFEGYSSTGAYLDTFTNAQGCDSLRYIVLYVETHSFNLVPITICDGESIYVGGVARTTSGTYYEDSIFGYRGCDSIVNGVILTVAPLPAAPVISQNGPELSVAGSYDGYQWYFNGGAISNSDTSGITALQNGEYVVEVSDSNDCAAFDTIQVTSVGLTGTAPVQQLSIYPNPGSGQFHISWPSGVSGESTLTVRNLLGAVVFNWQGRAGELKQLDLENTSNGIYLVEWQGAALGSGVFRLVVVR